MATWTPEAPVDLLYANATFQWVPDHQAVLKRLFAALPSGGVLAVQMPDNVATEPSHTLMRAVGVGGAVGARSSASRSRARRIGTPADYYNLLQGQAARIDIWHTLYNHPLAGAPAIVEMVRSTGLRPYLARLDAAEQARVPGALRGEAGGGLSAACRRQACSSAFPACSSSPCARERGSIGQQLDQPVGAGQPVGEHGGDALVEARGDLRLGSRAAGRGWRG